MTRADYYLQAAEAHANDAAVHLHERDEAIRQAHKHGAPVRTIAVIVGVSQADVAKIVNP